MLLLTAEVRDAIFAHAISCLPFEACGLFSMSAPATPGTPVDEFHPIDNAAASSTRFRLEPNEMLRVEADSDRRKRVIAGVMHSHVDTSPYPSPTDVTDSARFDPLAAFVHLIVSLRHAEPAMRCFTIRDGQIAEVRIVVDGFDPTADQGEPIARAAAMSIVDPVGRNASDGS